MTISTLDPGIQKMLLAAGFSKGEIKQAIVWNTPVVDVRASCWVPTEPCLQRIVNIDDHHDLPLFIADPKDSRLICMLSAVIRDPSLWLGLIAQGDCASYKATVSLSVALAPLWAAMLMLSDPS